jgi:hypothetical protein
MCVNVEYGRTKPSSDGSSSSSSSSSSQNSKSSSAEIPAIAAMELRLERFVAIHDGQIIRIDGHFKLPRHVKRFATWIFPRRANKGKGRRQTRAVSDERKFSALEKRVRLQSYFLPAGRVLVSATGTLGFMLRRSMLADEECGDSLVRLLRGIFADRKQFALQMAAAG